MLENKDFMEDFPFEKDDGKVQYYNGATYIFLAVWYAPHADCSAALLLGNAADADANAVRL